MRDHSRREWREIVPAWLPWLASAWALLYAIYRGYYALGGTFGMFGTPVSMSDWRLINGIAAVLLLLAAALPVATARLWERPRPRLALLAIGWVIAVGCVMHALIGIGTRLLSLSGDLHIEYPFFASIDRRAADLQALFLNEPWFLVEGLLWAALCWLALRSTRARAWWAGSAVAAIAGLTVIGLMSATGIIGRFIVG